MRPWAEGFALGDRGRAEGDPVCSLEPHAGFSPNLGLSFEERIWAQARLTFAEQIWQ